MKKFSFLLVGIVCMLLSTSVSAQTPCTSETGVTVSFVNPQNYPFPSYYSIKITWEVVGNTRPITRFEVFYLTSPQDFSKIFSISVCPEEIVSTKVDIYLGNLSPSVGTAPVLLLTHTEHGYFPGASFALF